MKRVYVTILFLALLIGIVGCSSKQESVHKIDIMKNAPKWVKEESFERDLIFARGSSPQMRSFRKSRDKAFEDAKKGILVKVERRFDLLFAKIDPTHAFFEATSKAKEELLASLEKEIRMQKLYEAQDGTIFLLASLRKATISKQFDTYATNFFKSYNKLYMNYLTLKKDGVVELTLQN